MARAPYPPIGEIEGTAMRKRRVSLRLRQRITEQSDYSCGYCLTSQRITGARMEVDHIIPESVGGATTEENLWLACSSCNEFKGAQTHAREPVTRRRVRLFNPRKQRWQFHFTWSEDGTEIIGLTPCGRATVIALQMNHEDIVRARRRWVSVGWWPPEVGD
ncbi:HNH endonuclease [Candidatus Poribacteria bacterium]|nr:HNH endonuclease [Candidatus Poribacteria bacterium]